MAKKIAKPLSDYRCKDCAHLGADNPKFLRNADRKRAESVVIVCDTTYAPFDIVKGGLLSENTMFGNLPESNDWNKAREWAKENGYKVSTQWICL